MRTEFHTLAVMLGLLSQAEAHRYQTPEIDVSRIDTHSHFVPPFWRDASVQYGFAKPDGMPGIPVCFTPLQNMFLTILAESLP